MGKILRPGYEVLYPTGVPHGDIKAEFSKLYGVPLEHVILRVTGGGAMCRDGRDDEQTDATSNPGDVPNDGTSGGDNEVTG